MKRPKKQIFAPESDDMSPKNAAGMHGKENLQDKLVKGRRSKSITKTSSGVSAQSIKKKFRKKIIQSKEDISPKNVAGMHGKEFAEKKADKTNYGAGPIKSDELNWGTEEDREKI